MHAGHQLLATCDTNMDFCSTHKIDVDIKKYNFNNPRAIKSWNFLSSKRIGNYKNAYGLMC